MCVYVRVRVYVCVYEGERRDRGVKGREKDTEKSCVWLYFRKMHFVCLCRTWINTAGHGQTLFCVRTPHTAYTKVMALSCIMHYSGKHTVENTGRAAT